MTTANFPDVMLPAYNVNFFYSFYFVIYLCFGLYLLLNLLLAKVFSNYRRRLELKVSMRSDNRVKLLEQFYNKFDEENKGFLTLNETKKFFKVTMDLNFRKERDQRLFLNLMRLVDPENKRIVYKERLIGYFSMPGFLDIERLNNIQRDEDDTTFNRSVDTSFITEREGNITPKRAASSSLITSPFL